MTDREREVAMDRLENLNHFISEAEERAWAASLAGAEVDRDRALIKVETLRIRKLLLLDEFPEIKYWHNE